MTKPHLTICKKAFNWSARSEMRTESDLNTLFLNHPWVAGGSGSAILVLLTSIS